MSQTITPIETRESSQQSSHHAGGQMRAGVYRGKGRVTV